MESQCVLSRTLSLPIVKGIFGLIARVRRDLVSVHAGRTLGRGGDTKNPLNHPGKSTTGRSFLSTGGRRIVDVLRHKSAIFRVYGHFGISEGACCVFGQGCKLWGRSFFHVCDRIRVTIDDVDSRTVPCPCYRSGSNVVLGFVPRVPTEGIDKVGVISAVIEHFVVTFVHESLLSV